MIQTLLPYFDFGNNQGGWYNWQVVNSDQVAAEILDVSKSAQTNALNAKTSADAAKTSADTAAARALTTINQTWYSGKYGGTSESAADISGYIRML